MLCTSLESGSQLKCSSSATADALCTVRDSECFRIKVSEVVRQFIERDQERPWKMSGLILPGMTDINKTYIV